MNLAEIRREAFEPHLEQKFELSADDVVLDAELIEVSPMGETPGPQGRRAFSLVFRAAPDAPPEQRIWRVEHAELGAMDLFLVPIGPDEKGMKFEAVFT